MSTICFCLAAYFAGIITVGIVYQWDKRKGREF